jgi:hypothetical protein
MNIEYGLFSRRTLNILLVLFVVVLTVILLSCAYLENLSPQKAQKA